VTAERLRAFPPLSPSAAPRPPRGTDALLSLFPYDGEAGEAVRRAKYGGLPFPADGAARLLHERLEGEWRERLPAGFTPAVVPVAVTPWKYLRRGFHLPSSVAASLARRAGLPFLPALLRRTREGEPQASLPLSRRRGNVRDAFRPGKRPAGAPPDVLLVDDVATSGATAESCAAALKAGGARFIVVITLARADLARPAAGEGRRPGRPGGRVA
jgi:predicted amidophosphoribosyltransferase